MLANYITISRIIMCFIVPVLLMQNCNKAYILAFILTIIVIWFDGLDGFVARKFNLSSKVGAMLDILGDRIVENVYWITFAALGWLNVAIPIIVVARGIITDGIRSVASQSGFTAFGQNTMMQSKIGKFIVASNFSRFTYALTKALAFAFLILAHTPNGLNGWGDKILPYALACAYISVVFCVLRGIPVVLESGRFFSNDKQ